MRTLGIVLIILGLIGFVIGGFSFTQTEEVADLGPVEIETEESRSVRIPPIASGAAVAAGLVLVVAGTMKPRQDRP